MGMEEMTITYRSGSFANGSTATAVTKDGERISAMGCSRDEAIGSLIIKLVEIKADTSNLEIVNSNPKTYSDRVRFNENAARNAARTRSLNKSKNDLTNKKSML